MIALFTQGPPPNTGAYYRIAYVWLVILYGGYAGSLWWRARNVRARLAASGKHDAQARDT